MGAVDTKKNPAPPPLPAPTETESTTTTELATDLSRPADDKSSYSLPEDGTPVTIKTRHKANRSQTSLLIEYFEGGKGPPASGSGGERKPSVRVRLTPSKNRRNDHIQITETKSTRKASLGRKPMPNTPTAGVHLEGEGLSILSGDGDDAHSMNSYASATEESNVSRHPIDIEIDSRRRRRPASPLIPTADSKASYQPGAMSDISAIPTDSFLDGSGPSSKAPEPHSRTGDVLAGAATGLAAAAVADKLRSRSRGDTKDRVNVSKTRDATEKSERKHKSKSRSGSVSEKTDKDGRRRSSRSHQESAVSAADSSIVSSGLSPSHRSQDQYSVRSGASKASSINNPKLLETVEDAIRRLILPELNALKREQSRQNKDRRSSAASTTTSASRDDPGSEKRASSGRDSLGKVKETKDRDSRHDYSESPVHSLSHESVDESIHETPGHSSDKLRTAAAAAAIGGLAGAALADKSPAFAREQRKRRREAKSRAADKHSEAYESSEHLQAPAAMPLPLSSEINPSELTRTSILSAESEGAHSASEEMTPAGEARRGPGSTDSSPTPTRQQATLASLGTKHANISHGDLRALPRVGTGVMVDSFDTDEYGRRYPVTPQDDDYDDYDDEAEEMYRSQYGGQSGYNYYDTQDVPAPLRYEPYQLERRGLSPIPSVSGYTEGGSEVQAPQNRDSRGTQVTSPSKLSQHERVPPSPSSIPSNVVGHEFDQDDRSLRSSGVGYRNTAYTEDSEVDHVTSGQEVQGVGALANFVHIQSGVESNVASLVDGSILDDSVLSAEIGPAGGNYYGTGRGSMATLEEEELSHGHATPSKRSLNGSLAKGGRAVSPQSPGAASSHRSHASAQSHDRSQPPSAAYAGEYELDHYGRKVPKSAHTADRQSPTASEAAITGPAVFAASQALKNAALKRDQQHPSQAESVEEYDEDYAPVGAGVQRNKSFKERTMDGWRPANTPSHSVDRLVDHDARPKMAASGFPDAQDPMPEIGYYEASNPSVVEGRLGGSVHSDARDDDHWSAGHRTPTQEHSKRGEHGLGTAAAVVAGAAALGAAAAMASSHSRQPSQDQDEEWRRTSDDRKRDTLVTNPFEGTSPNVNLPGLGDPGLLVGGAPVFQNAAFGAGYSSASPLGHNKVDEGYMSQGANKTPDQHAAGDKGKGVDFSQPMGLEDPFYAPNGPPTNLLGASRAMGTPLYDSATGEGIDNIESKDIIALMQHLAVRDAQRTARDTEILVTLVRSAAEMRDSFEKIKGMICDSEDVIIKEIGVNTENTVQRAIGGPRPLPGSAPARSIQGAGGSQTGTEDLPTKKQNLFRRALKGLSAKGNNDLGRIEDMLMQLLTEVDTLKAQTAVAGMGAGAGSPGHGHGDAHSFDNLNLQPAVTYEHDRGYEPEGNPGTSTASHASQSGQLSIPLSRNASAKLGYERKFSDHRISTVPEANEDEYDGHHLHHQHSQHSQRFGAEMLDTRRPGDDDDDELRRSGSVPLATPPQHTGLSAGGAQQASLSNENTPRTDKSKKHKSAGSSNWFPKISRWSETTTSSVGKVFRSSRDSKKDADNTGGSGDFHGPSRSGSDLADYEYGGTHDPYGDDRLHSGLSEQDFLAQAQADQHMMAPMQHQTPPHLPSTTMDYLMDEDPKYKAHRNSMNLQHPQPRSGQPFRATLERRAHAQDFDAPHSPHSGNWAGSANSLPHYHGGDSRAKRYSDVSASGELQLQQQQLWESSPGGPPTSAAGPPKPPKEPLEEGGHMTPPKTNRVSKLQKNSPLPYHSVESGYGTATHASFTGSPRLENRNLSGALSSGMPARRPSGPRAMTPKSIGSLDEDRERRRSKRDTFGTTASQDSETF